MKKVLVTLLVLAALVVGLDRGGDFVAERLTAGALQESQGLAERPDVDINGIPFLDQLAASRYDQVEVRADDVPLDDGGDLVVSRLELTLDDVTTTRDFSTIEVARARADGVIGFDSLGQALGVDLAYGGDGSVKISTSFEVLGQEISPGVTVEPEVVDGALGFGKPVLNGVADLGGAVTDALGDTFGLTVPMDGLPFDVDLDDVSVERDGLHLMLSGKNLRYDDSAGDGSSQS